MKTPNLPTTRFISTTAPKSPYHYSLNDISNDTSLLRRGTRSGSVANTTISDLPLEIEYPTYRQRRYYDKLQRLIRTTNILDEDTNYSLTYQYDAAGNILSQTDQEGKTTSFEYDALTRLVKVIDTKGGITRLEYDARDNIIAVHDPKAGITRYQYDKNNNVVKQIRPEGQITRYEHDPAGNQTARFDAKGQKIAYQYDALSRLTQVDYYTADDHQTPVKTVHLTYDIIGNLISYNDGTTSATYTYNALGQKLTETVNYGPFTLSHSYEYYANGLKKSFTGPDNVKITYSYDENNRLNAIDIPNAGRITYNTYHWNHPAKITLPGGSQIDLTYDPLMRLLSKTVKDPSQQSLLDYEYEYSPTNNITKKTTEQGEHAYQYDELSRLTQATHPALEDEQYTYDLLSNRLTASNIEGICHYDANNALLNYGNTEFEYDPNGNLVKKTTGTQITHYEYNIEDRLVRVTNNQDDLIAEYGYDPSGRRIWKKVEGIKTYFVYADEGLIGEYDENGTETKAYGYRPNSMWTTNPLFQKTNGSYYWYQTDHLGTPQKLIDSQGDVVWEAVYEAFGKALVDVELVENHLRFAGQYFDGETGLHYNWHRYYEPTTGRYLSIDPIYSANLYAYVSGNPLIFIDPFGLEKILTEQEVKELFEKMAAMDLAFHNPRGGCESRAHLMIEEMLKMDKELSPFKFWAFSGTVKMYVERWKNKFPWWSFHVAPGVRGIINDEETNVIIDPALFNHPVDAQTWLDELVNELYVTKSQPNQPPTITLDNGKTHTFEGSYVPHLPDSTFPTDGWFFDRGTITEESQEVIECAKTKKCWGWGGSWR